MLCHIYPLVLAFFSVVASTKAAKPFPNLSSPLTREVLKVRGGWNLLDEIDTSKAITGLGLTVGTATSLSARKVLEKCDIKTVDPLSLLVTRRIGVTILSFSIVSYFLQFQDVSTSTAVGIGCLPTVIELSKTLFDGTHKELKFPAAGQLIVIFVTALFGVLFVNDSHIGGGSLLKIHSGWLIANGILMGCFPKLGCKAWGDIDATALLALQYFVSLWGFGLLSLGTLSGCLAWGMVTSKATAISALPFFSRLILSKMA